MPRAKRRPLRLVDRRKLACGALRRFRDGDDVNALAQRMGQPERRLQEALDEPFERVRSRIGRGVTAADLAEGTGLPLSFVKYAMRRVHARSRPLGERSRLPYARRTRVPKADAPSRQGGRTCSERSAYEGIESAMLVRGLSELLEDI